MGPFLFTVIKRHVMPWFLVVAGPGQPLPCFPSVAFPFGSAVSLTPSLYSLCTLVSLHTALLTAICFMIVCFHPTFNSCSCIVRKVCPLWLCSWLFTFPCELSDGPGLGTGKAVQPALLTTPLHLLAAREEDC